MFKNVFENIFHKEEKALKNKTHFIDIAKSPVTTKDNVVIQVGGLLSYDVIDYKLYKTGGICSNVELQHLAITTFGNIISGYDANNVTMGLRDINAIAHAVIKNEVAKCGIRLVNVEINNIVIPEVAFKKV